MAQTVKLTIGTKEYVCIRLRDELEHLTTLTGSDLRYDLFRVDDTKPDEEEMIVENVSCANEGMIATPLIDTTDIDFVEGWYHIYITFVASPEELRKGPYRILVAD